MKYFISFILLLFFCGCEPYFMKYAARCAGADDKSAQKNMYWFKDRYKYSYFYEGEYRTYASKNENDVLARPDYPIFVISHCDDKWCEVVEKCSDIKVFVKKSDIIPYKR